MSVIEFTDNDQDLLAAAAAFCGDCGAKLGPGAKSCGECGAKQGEA